jgi:hypothetical protein
MALARRFESLVFKEIMYNNLAQLFEDLVFTSLCALDLNSLAYTLGLVKLSRTFGNLITTAALSFLKKVAFPILAIMCSQSRVRCLWNGCAYSRIISQAF